MHDADALLLAKSYDKAGEDWSLSLIAKKLGVHRSALDGGKANGDYRCPEFMKYAKKKGKSGEVRKARKKPKLTLREDMGDVADCNADDPANVAAAREVGDQQALE